MFELQCFGVEFCSCNECQTITARAAQRATFCTAGNPKTCCRNGLAVLQNAESSLVLCL